MKSFHLSIITPYGQYLDLDNVEFLEVASTDFVLGILPDHAPLISTLAINIMEVTVSGQKTKYSIGGGIIKIEKENNVILLLDSIESGNEIDAERALAAKERAEKRLLEADKYDVKRANLALARALNRLRLIGKGDQ